MLKDVKFDNDQGMVAETESWLKKILNVLSKTGRK